MGTITDKLNKLAETKSAIKTAIVNKGVSISDTDTFASYADKIASISGGGSTATEGIYGVFIYDTNGNLTKPEEWDTTNNDLAVGVAVIDENCSFVIGKTQKYSEIAWSNTLNGTSVSGIVTTADINIAKIDYAGEANSSIVRGLTSGETNAFNWAYDKTITVNGTTLYGYIGAAGEWQTAFNNRSAVNSALSTIGGTSMVTYDYHWTSTQYSSDRAWTLHWGYDNVSYRNKSYDYYVRAFYHLDYPNNKIATKLNNGNVVVTGSNYTIPNGSFNHIIIDGDRAYPNLDSLEYNTDSYSDISALFYKTNYSDSNIDYRLNGGNITINAPNCRRITYLFGNNSYPCGDKPITININASESIYNISRLLWHYRGEINLNIKNISNITDFSYLLYENREITKIGELDTSGGTYLSEIFQYCNNLIKISSLSLKSLNNQIAYSYFTGYSEMPNLRYALIKDLGTGSSCTSADFSYWTNWGVEDETIELSAGARQSLIDTLITYSYDRATAGYSTCTVTLHSNTKALLTEDEIAQITAKGYTLA